MQTSRPGWLHSVRLRLSAVLAERPLRADFTRWVRQERTVDKEFARRALSMSTVHPRPDFRRDQNSHA